tara:strand:+ start:160 stop:552 length:393 start_codon:yes stop_codon:yes gene_type:complete
VSRKDEIAALEAKIETAKTMVSEPIVDSTATVTAAADAALQSSFLLSCSILIFGLVVLFLIGYLIKVGKDPEDLLRSFGTVLIIIAAVFLIVAGYSEKQIAPVIGLLGTVAGYLLGKSHSNRNGHNNASQ